MEIILQVLTEPSGSRLDPNSGSEFGLVRSIFLARAYQRNRWVDLASLSLPGPREDRLRSLVSEGEVVEGRVLQASHGGIGDRRPVVYPS